MFKNFCLVLFCCGFTSLALGADRFIIKYKPDPIQNKELAKGGMAAKAVREQMMQRLSSVQVKALSDFAGGVKFQEINQIATGAHVFIADKNLSETEAKNFVDNLQANPAIEYAEEDRILKTVTTSANPAWQWDVYNLGEFAVEPSWVGDDFFDAWTALGAVGYGVGTNVVVGVIDTGYTPHPNFLSALQKLGASSGVYGYQLISDCRISGQCSPSTSSALAVNYPYQSNALDLGDYVSQADINSSNGFFTADCYDPISSWHGSHVTGIIAANGYSAANPSYVAGGAYGATVVPVRVLGKCGGYLSDVTNGMLWAAGLNVSSNGVAVPVNPNPVQVMNLSLGGSGSCTKTEQDTINTINSTTQNGTIIVVAAGNNEGNISDFNPASCSGVIVVAAKGPTNQLAFYSNHGATTITASGGDSTIFGCYTGSSGTKICPSSIYSTIWSSLQGYQSESMGGSANFAFYQGTSMATPQVVAAVADIISVLKAKNKNYTLYGIISILQQTAKPYTNCSLFGCAGTGTLDTAAAITYALQNDVPAAAPAPAPLISTSGAGGSSGGGGGCSAIADGDDYSLILLLVLGSALYVYRRRKVFKK